MSETTTEEERVASVKAILMQNMNGGYMQLIQFVRELPIDEEIKKFAIQNLDQGVMWVEQGIKLLKFKVPEEQTQPEPEQQTNEVVQ